MTEVLHRYFDGYTGRRDDLHAHMGSFTGAIDAVAGNTFAGIKLYPPLDFDPWPRRKSPDRDNVEALYAFCESRQIPITAHCSDLGFTVAKKADAYTNPQKWRNVLKHYRKLKLNLAHFGHQEKRFGFIPRHKWRETIIDLVLSHDQVYTDVSCLAFDEDFYGSIDHLLQSHESHRDKLSQRILFGSDYMIHLMWANSYNEYLDLFIKTNRIGDKEKVSFCNVNPARFLFLQW
jgi:predicted TIM-barrel fold metal-dependent hydrolase